MSAPTAEVVRWTAKQVVIRCPHCGEEHRHGRDAGHRVAHCARPSPTSSLGYVIPRIALFCSLCGCYYGAHRRAGDPCGDQSGGVNDGSPCVGVLRMEPYTLAVHNRQRASLFMPAVDVIIPMEGES